MADAETRRMAQDAMRSSYRWTSTLAYVQANCPELLDRDPTLAMLALQLEMATAAFGKRIEQLVGSTDESGELI